MARLLTRKGKKKTTFTITVRVKGYESVSRTFDTKGEARTWAVEVEAEMKGHRFKDPRRANKTLDEALDRYLETVTTQKAQTTQERERRLAKILKQHLGGNTLLPEITPSVVAKFRDQRLSKVSAYAVRLELASRSLTLYITKNEPRTVPLTKAVVSALQAIKDKNDADFVFLKGEGKSTHARNIPSSRFRPAFDHARERAGLQSVHMHDLRHTAASHMLMAGTDLRTLAAILGHSTLQMVLRYTHLLDEHKLSAVDRINSFGMK